MTLTTYQDYFEDLARKCMAIGHNPDEGIIRFCVFEPDEVADFAKINDMNHFSMALKKFEYRTSNTNSGPVRKFYECGFVIFRTQGRTTSVDEKTLIQDQAEEICNDIWLLLRHLQEIEGAGWLTIAGRKHQLEMSSFSGGPVSGLVNKGAGWDASFTLSEFTNHQQYDPSKFSH